MIDASKIIHGAVGGGRYTVTSPIVKEDYGLYLKIEGLELPSTYEVDFSNSEHNGTSVTMIGNADGVLIPSQFIASGKDVFAFLYHVGVDFGRTVYKFRIPNKCRPDRTNEQPTPEEQSVIDQAISALNEAVAKTAQDVIDADASAQSASQSAEQAEDARTDAQNYATQAEQSATDAQTSAESASASATASAQSAEQSATNSADAQDSAEEAQGYASASAQSASASANSASQASGYAQSASSYASSAQGYASQAQTSAQTASSKASEASTSASTASTKASESAQSASQALGYKTDAESAKTASQTAQGLAESARDSAVSAKTDAESARDDAVQAKEDAESAVASISGALDDKAPVITDTASGAIASFSDGADDLPLKSLIVDINPIQDLHGQDAPYPAGGGKNKFGGVYGENFELHIANDTVVTAYADKACTIAYYDSDGSTRIDYWSINTAVTGGYARTFTMIGDSSYFRFLSASDTPTKMQIELSSSFTGYAPYENICPISGWTGMQLNANGTVIPISWQTEAGTVYGGKLDVLTGILTVYPYYANYNGESLTGRWISDRDVYAVGTTPTIGAQVVNIGAEGTEYQLEPHEVKSLLGQNNIFADTGDVTAEYRADTRLYIEKLAQPEEDDMVADSAITSGQFFMIGNTLYRALANIASGATITVGTNAQRVSLSDALNLINT